MNFFVANFATVSAGAEQFNADKRGNLPVIGNVVAGKAIGSLINGTIFQSDNRKEGQLYLCENYIDDEYPDYPQTRIITEVTAVELITFRKELGEGKLIRPNTAEPTAVEAPVVDESEVVAD